MHMFITNEMDIRMMLNTVVVSDWASISSSSDGTKLAVVSTNKGLLYTSNNSGLVWTLQSTGLPKEQPFWVQIVSSTDGTQLAVVGMPIRSSPGVGGFIDNSFVECAIKSILPPMRRLQL